MAGPEITDNTGIVVAIREDGVKVVTEQLTKLADSVEKLSPAFAKTLRGRALRLGANLESEIKKAANVAVERIIHTTPHDTGQARANWEVSIGESPHVPTVTADFSRTDYDGDSTIAAGQAVINNTKRQPGEAIFIANGLPYIEPLNQGHASAQAPAMFVERAVQAAVNSVKRGLKGIFEQR